MTGLKTGFDKSVSLGNRNKGFKEKDLHRLCSLFIDMIKRDEKRLSKEVLDHYVESALEKKDVFFESVSRFGSPQYFFDEPSLSHQIRRFNTVFAKHLSKYRWFYAVKSNSFPGVCRHVIEAGMGLDVSSGYELSMALAMGSRDIIFSGPGKTDDELLLALKNRRGVTLLMDSIGELERITTLMKRMRTDEKRLKAGIRVRSEQKNLWNKFGIPINELAGVFKKAIGVEGLSLCGIQFHTSWNLDPSAQTHMISEVGSYIHAHLPTDCWKMLEFMDIGGGYWPELGEWYNPNQTRKGKLMELLDPPAKFGTAHFWREARPLDDFAKMIALTLSSEGAPLCDLEIWMEPGRWISTPAMHILLKVIDKKDAHTVITDGGTNLLGWERPLSEFIPVINLTRPSFKEHSMAIFGSLCTPLDVWGTTVFGQGIERGDILLVPEQGAYTYSLRQSFIKPRARVIRYDGKVLEEVEKEERFE